MNFLTKAFSALSPMSRHSAHMSSAQSALFRALKDMDMTPEDLAKMLKKTPAAQSVEAGRIEQDPVANTLSDIMGEPVKEVYKDLSDALNQLD
jgi:hypothetical protein